MADDDFDRVPPHDIAAEQCVLGGMMLSKGAIADVIEVIKPEDHYRPAHQTVHQVILDLYGRGEPVDAVSAAAELTRRGDIAQVGGAPYLHTLIASVPTAANAGYYARIVRERAILRRVAEVGTRIAQAGYAGDSDPDSVFDMVRGWIDDAAAAGAASASDDDIAALAYQVLDEITKHPGETPGLLTGIHDLDDSLNRLRESQFIVIAGRPGAGKSVIGLNIGANVALRQRRRVHIHSLEMNRSELMMRLLSAEARVPLHRLISRQIDDRDLGRLADAQALIADSPMHIFDKPAGSLLDIRSELRAATAAKDPAALVVVDYIGLMSAPRRVDNRQQEVSDLSRGLKLLAKEFHVPVVGLAQLNRGPEHRPDKRPVVSDLRESGSLEQDSDVVLLLHRDDMYDKESPRAGEIDIIVGKQRNGPQTTVTAAFQGWYSRIIDLAQNWSPSDAARSA